MSKERFVRKCGLVDIHQVLDENGNIRYDENGNACYVLRIPHTGESMLTFRHTLPEAVAHANRFTQNAFHSASRAGEAAQFHVPCGTCGVPANPAKKNCPECGARIPLHVLNNVVIPKYEE